MCAENPLPTGAPVRVVSQTVGTDELLLALAEPEQIAASIRKFMPGFTMDYDVDPLRQGIAESWPDSLDCSAAREEWGFAPEYDLDRMSEDMLARLKEKL